MVNFNVQAEENTDNILIFINKYRFKINISDLYELITDLNKVKFQIIKKKQNNEIDNNN